MPALDQVRVQICDYLRESGVELAYLFGSRARGTARADSDWDIAVRFDESLSSMKAMTRLARMQLDLKDMLRSPVDLSWLNQAGPTLLYESVWKGVCLLHPGDEERRIAYELEIRRKFEDYQHIQSFYNRALEERLGTAK